MKKSNEFITLRLYSLEQALNVIDCLFDNGYNNVHIQDIDRVEEATTRLFKTKLFKKHLTAYYIEIDNEMKEYHIYPKPLDFIDIRKDKIKKIKDEISKIK